MIRALFPAATALLLTPYMVSAMPEERALTLAVEERDGTLEVQLIGHSAETQKVSYAIEVTGRSTARHSGSTTLAAGSHAVLSTLRAQVEEDWCVRLTAEEEGRAPYEIVKGTCPEG